MTVVLIVLMILTAVCAAWAALAWLPAGADLHMPLPYLIALIPFLWIPMVVVAVAAAVAGCPAWAVVAPIVVAVASRARQARYLARWRGFGGSPSRRRRRVDDDAMGDDDRLSGVDDGVGGDSAADAAVSGDDARAAAALRARIRETLRENAVHERETAQDVLGQRASAAASFNVMTVNCRFGRADAKSIVGAVLARDISVLALQELTQELVDALDANGLDLLLPYRRLGKARDSDNGGFNGIWMRVDPKESTSSIIDIPAADLPAATIQIDPQRDITFVSAHPKSPMRSLQDWSAGIIGLGGLARRDGRRERDITVILGDLNSGIDHPSFRTLLDAGFRDANLTVARGPQPTFPRWLRWPRIILDHILADGDATFGDVESFEIKDTDHLALAATLVID
ncbi:endonuclease/exonuclease/phosphatase family protein [Bifidobacterium samirii]|uniref:Endonuclease n=1 Tax=Bifidobacterium samirii TaxID=2306974 RepID=A0A430FW80_9BIFI|nr:endonuclease/exonuclease/phosphatase family protein [Bifidobacterium samirii]RSX58364.1 endonuclease [Bifidobacterium samirii]